MLDLTDKPDIYRGYEIHWRSLDWLVVKDGVALTMRAGINGARSFIDTLIPQA
jgi:hypothetical protein